MGLRWEQSILFTVYVVCVCVRRKKHSQINSVCVCLTDIEATTCRLGGQFLYVPVCMSVLVWLIEYLSKKSECM
eukprot:m.5655 g.5655  ORF g.5655 m.5655 type:complete len:74 (+) comp4498_c0_seq1:151-372(+)